MNAQWVLSRPPHKRYGGLYHQVKDPVRCRTYCGRRYDLKSRVAVWFAVEGTPTTNNGCRVCQRAIERDGTRTVRIK